MLPLFLKPNILLERITEKVDTSIWLEFYLIDFRKIGNKVSLCAIWTQSLKENY